MRVGAAFSQTLPPTLAVNASASMGTPLQANCSVCVDGDALSAALAFGWWHDGVKLESLDENARFSMSTSKATLAPNTAYSLNGTSFQSTCPQLYTSSLVWNGVGRPNNALDGPADFGNYSCAFSYSTSANADTRSWSDASTMKLLISCALECSSALHRLDSNTGI